MLEHRIEYVARNSLTPFTTNARTHSARQIEQIASSIQKFGFTAPVLVDDNLTILAGHARVRAAELIGVDQVPIVRLSHLNAEERRAYVLADNRLAEKAGWDKETLAIELLALTDLNFDVGALGFEIAEVDTIIECHFNAMTEASDADADACPSVPDDTVTEPGDLWVLGRHRLVCGDARDQCAYASVMEDQKAHLIFADPPYNVPIVGFVGGSGKNKHKNFAMACGEMSSDEFVAFLSEAMAAAAAQCNNGALAFVCMDWRHMRELLRASSDAFSEMKNLCVWTKTNAGMGSLYRSQHELVFVFKVGDASHCNNVQLGRFGPNRSNVWSYPGVNTFKDGRDAELAMHPTVKPVAMIEDAIKDVTRRGEIVLDPFAGSGSTLIAAEKCGRTARLMEIDPRYCDVIVRRFETFTGKHAERISASQIIDDSNR